MSMLVCLRKITINVEILTVLKLKLVDKKVKFAEFILINRIKYVLSIRTVNTQKLLKLKVR